jgi:hypothetical protein
MVMRAHPREADVAEAACMYMYSATYIDIHIYIYDKYVYPYIYIYTHTHTHTGFMFSAVIKNSNEHMRAQVAKSGGT